MYYATFKGRKYQGCRQFESLEKLQQFELPFEVDVYVETERCTFYNDEAEKYELHLKLTEEIYQIPILCGKDEVLYLRAYREPYDQVSRKNESDFEAKVRQLFPNPIPRLVYYLGDLIECQQIDQQLAMGYSNSDPQRILTTDEYLGQLEHPVVQQEVRAYLQDCIQNGIGTPGGYVGAYSRMLLMDQWLSNYVNEDPDEAEKVGIWLCSRWARHFMDGVDTYADFLEQIPQVIDREWDYNRF